MPARIIDTHGPGLEILDVGDLDDGAMGDVLSAAASEPYELATAGTARFRLYRRRNIDAVLLCGNHHIVSDAASQFVIWRDLLIAYGALTRGESPEFPQLDWTWNDQVADEQRKLAGPMGARWTEYWRSACREVPAGELPLDRPRPSRPSFRGATVAAAVPADLARMVRGSARQLGVTPFAIHLATLQTVIHRISGRGQFLIGCPISLRRSRRTLHSVGYYLAMVLVRADIRANSTCGTVALAAAQELRDASAAGGLPYPHIVRAVARDTKTGPLYRIAITQVGKKASFDEIRLNCIVEPFDVVMQQRHCDLDVQVVEGAGGDAIVLRYDDELFHEATIRRFLEMYLDLLNAGATDPGIPITPSAMQPGRPEQRPDVPPIAQI
jgi:hypothetical protein